ncbi:MAG: DUF1223 domain-containing protein [Chitinophagaceae bacterium]|nr:DUF1223 domain-containing protein [Rubrivivax sp.]
MMITLQTAVLLCGLATGAAASAQAVCQASSTAVAPTVVELYTSEGCSSCPPADKWLSTLKGRDDVLALSFHVTYWDRLGWPDPFASAAYTQRQYDWASLHGSSNVYTPQTVVNGRDWRQWPNLPRPAQAGAAAPVKLVLTRQGDQVLAEVSAAAAGTPALAGYWAVLEDGHSSRVKAGENAGETLRHDHVVRLLKPVPQWAAASGLRSQFSVVKGAPETPRRVAFVVVDAKTQRPVQALALAC